MLALAGTIIQLEQKTISRSLTPFVQAALQPTYVVSREPCPFRRIVFDLKVS